MYGEDDLGASQEMDDAMGEGGGMGGAMAPTGDFATYVGEDGADVDKEAFQWEDGT